MSTLSSELNKTWQDPLWIVEVDTAARLLELLHVTNTEWRKYPTDTIDGWRNDWVYRGQANADWQLKPSAWRFEKDKKHPIEKHPLENYVSNSVLDNLRSEVKTMLDADKFKSKGKSIITSFTESIKHHHYYTISEENFSSRLANMLLYASIENYVVLNFALLADSQGFRMPDFSGYMKSAMKIPKTYLSHLKTVLKGNNHYQDYYFWRHPIVTLAQHHGIKTRLMDWTSNALFAVHMACEDVIKHQLKYENGEIKESPSEKMALYAFDKSWLRAKSANKIDIIYYQHTENLFLDRQSGSFSLDYGAEFLYLQNGYYPSLEESILYYKEKNIKGESRGKFKPHKFILPASEAPELMRLLHLEGVTRASLMPTLDNVAQTLNLRGRLTSHLR